MACDVWGELPLRDGAADLALNVFAPRNGGEIARVLAPDGALIVVTPTPRHLQELAALPGMLRVDERKDERVQAALSSSLSLGGTTRAGAAAGAVPDDVRRLVAMGPSARHVDPDELERGLAELAEPATVTASVTIETFRPG